MPTASLKELDPRANPFDFKGGPQAALLIHGYTGTPAEMLPVGMMISQKLGWRALCPLLPGHGTTIEDLDRSSAEDWLRAAEEASSKLVRENSQVHLVGLSMGALLALELFRKDPRAYASLSLLAPALFLKTWTQRIVTPLMRCSWISRFVPAVKKTTPRLPDHVAYDYYPAKASGEFSKVYLKARSLVKMEAPPTFICVSETDELVDLHSADFLAERLSNPFTRVVRLQRSTHVVTIGAERERLLEAMYSFYREITPAQVRGEKRGTQY